jgi:transcriptional antiterminator NusG
MEDRATTTPDLEGEPGTPEEALAGSVSEGLPEDTKSVEATAAGIDPDTPEAIDPVASTAAESSALEIPAVTFPGIAVDDESVETSEEVAESVAEAEDVVVAEPESETVDKGEDVEVAEPEPESEAVDKGEDVGVAEPEPEAEAEAAPVVEAVDVEVAVAEAESDESSDDEDDDAEAEDEGPASPYDLAGDWYVIHSYSGYENKVKVNLETRIHSMHLEGEIFDVVIPMEDVVEIKGGRKVTVPKKVFPGYILVRMYMTDDSWFGVRNTPGVTGFVGSGTKPTPLSRREVERILGVKKAEEGEKAAPRFKPAWDVGETVRVVEGPFADFNGVIEEINLDQSKVRVLVNIFGRDTPVELNFEQIVKL